MEPDTDAPTTAPRSPDQVPPYTPPDHVVLSGGHQVALATGRFEETRWFQYQATAHPAVLFSPGTRLAPDDPHATVTVTLEGTATANEFSAWTVDTLSVSGGDRPSVTYFAHPELAADLQADAHPVLPAPPVGMRRGPAQPMSNAPSGLRELIARLVALDPTAPATRADEAVTDPSLVRNPLTERLVHQLTAMGVDYQLLHRGAVEELIDGVLSAIAQRFPARTVRLGPDAHPPTADSLG